MKNLAQNLTILLLLSGSGGTVELNSLTGFSVKDMYQGLVATGQEMSQKKGKKRRGPKFQLYAQTGAELGFTDEFQMNDEELEKMTEEKKPENDQKVQAAPKNATAFIQEIDLKNFNNQQYMGNIFVGNSKQAIPVLFDTGSPMVYMLTNSCDKALCPQESKFNTFSSSSYKANSDGISDDLAHCYGQGCVNGSVSKDKICLNETGDENGCVTGTFLAVKEATDIEKDKFSGIVGLGPKSDVARMPAFVEQLEEMGGVGGQNILSPIFSFYLTNNEDKSGKLTFGGYDLKKYAKPGKTEKDIFWA